MTVYLGFDFGTRRIGVSVGDSVTRSARPLPAITQDWSAIGRLNAEWGPAAFVVGLPLGRDGEDQPMTGRARAFAAELKSRFGRPVYLCDERYTSVAAQGDLRLARAGGTLRRRVRKGDEDSAAARLILEQWLAEPRETQDRGRKTDKP